MHVRFGLGLTGGIASGKSTVATLFADLDVDIIDTDLIAHALTKPDGKAMPEILKQFGKEFVDTSGAMDRQKMRTHVFAQAAARKCLEQILHPLIWQECKRQAARGQSPYFIYVVPLLVESGKWLERVQRILVVDCPVETQLNRLLVRSGLTLEQANAIIAAQASRAERLAIADDVIDSDADLSQVRIQVEQLHQKYSQFAL